MSDNKPPYSVFIQWSDDDQVYLVSFPEWEGRVFNPVTHGDTYEDAIRNGHEALDALIASAHKHGESLPEPHIFSGSGVG